MIQQVDFHYSVRLLGMYLLGLVKLGSLGIGKSPENLAMYRKIYLGKVHHQDLSLLA